MVRKTIFLLLIFPALAFGQTEVMRKSPRNYNDIPLWGPNRAHHVQGFVGVGFFMPLGAAEGHFKPGVSYDVHLGAKYRFRVSNFLNIGAGLFLSSYQIMLTDSGMVKGWDGNVHEKAQMVNYHLTLKPFMRFNLSPRRGDYLGTYFDLGGFGSWGLLPATSFTDRVDGQKLLTRYMNDKRYEPILYGGMAAVGRDWFRLEASYYLSGWLKEPAGINLPKYSVSVLFGF